MKKGMAIPLVLLAIVILFILGFSISNSAVQHALMANHETASKNAYGQANAGLSQILYYLSTVNGWNNLASDSNLTTFANGTGIANNPKAGTDPNFFYRVNVSPLVGVGFDQYTAKVTVTGFAVRNSNPNQVLLKRTLNASMHHQNPRSLNASIFAEGCLTVNGSPNVTTDGAHKVIAFCPQDLNLTVLPTPGSYQELDPLNQNDKKNWFLPKIDEVDVINLAKANNINNWNPPAWPEPASCGGGHYYCSSYLSTYLVGTTFKIKLAINNLDGTILIEFPSVGGPYTAEIEPPLTSTSTSTFPNLNPNILIVKGGDLKIAGGVTYNGVILVPDGEVKVSGSTTIIGAVFAKKGFIGGGANWTVTYNQNYVIDFAQFVLRQVVVDSLWENN